MSSLYFFVGIMVVSLVIITLVSALEKRMVWPYVPAAEAPPGQCPPPDAYATANAAAATAAGFQWLGTYADAKGKIYRVRYDFFRAPSGDVLATVGTGTVASISLQTTWLHTLLSDGRCLVTFNHQNGGEIDLAGVAEEALIGNLSLAGMVDAHRARIGVSGRTVEVFQEGSPLADLRAYRQRRIKRLVALGYAGFLDKEDNIWRYSLKGAAVLAFRQYFTALRRVFVPDKARPAGSRTH